MGDSFHCGEVIKTPYGDCKVTSVRAANASSSTTVCCVPTSWQLADYSTSQPRFFLNPEVCSRNLFQVNDRVLSPYGGAGVIKAVRDKHYVIELTKWALANGKSPVQYLTHAAVKLDVEAQKKDKSRKTKAVAKSPDLFQVNDRVLSPYGGAGVIKAVRDKHYVIELTKWALANGKSPVQYLTHSAVKLDVEAQKKAKDELRQQTQWREYLDRATNSKNDAAKLFSQKDFAGAKNAYLAALGSLNSMGTDLPDHLRAEVLEHTMPCSNNVALCCMKNGQYGESMQYAYNVLMLVNALDEQIYNGGSQAYQNNGARKLSMVWLAFKRRGMTYAKLIRDWKKKSLFYMGKASLLARDYDNAIEFLSQSLAVLITPLEGSLNAALANCDGTIDEVRKLVNDNLYLTTETKANGDVDVRGPANEKLDEKAEAEKQKQVKEINELLQQAKVEKRKSEKKEQQTWSKAFAKSAEEAEEKAAAEKAAAEKAAAEKAAADKAAADKAAAVFAAKTSSVKLSSSASVDVDKYLTASPASNAKANSSKIGAPVSPRSVAAPVSPMVDNAHDNDAEDGDEEEDKESSLPFGLTLKTGLGLVGLVGFGVAWFAWSRPKAK